MSNINTNPFDQPAFLEGLEAAGYLQRLDTSEARITARYQHALAKMKFAAHSEEFLGQMGVTRVHGSTVQFFNESPVSDPFVHVMVGSLPASRQELVTPIGLPTSGWTPIGSRLESEGTIHFTVSINGFWPLTVVFDSNAQDVAGESRHSTIGGGLGTSSSYLDDEVAGRSGLGGGRRGMSSGSAYDAYGAGRSARSLGADEGSDSEDELMAGGGASSAYVRSTGSAVLRGGASARSRARSSLADADDDAYGGGSGATMASIARSASRSRARSALADDDGDAYGGGAGPSMASRARSASRSRARSGSTSGTTMADLMAGTDALGLGDDSYGSRSGGGGAGSAYGRSSSSALGRNASSSFGDDDAYAVGGTAGRRAGSMSSRRSARSARR